jgi:hypothetical protein
MMKIIFGFWAGAEIAGKLMLKNSVTVAMVMKA